jgi:hypothetical protein
MFAKLRKTTVSFPIPAVCLSVCLEEVSTHWTDFHDIWCLSIPRKSIEKIQMSSNLLRMTSTSHEDLHKFTIISRRILLRMRNIPDKSCRKNQKTRYMFIIFKEYLCILWDTVQVAIWYSACTLHPGQLRLQTHTHNVQYLVVSHGNSCYAEAPQCYVSRTLLVLFMIIFDATLCRSVWCKLHGEVSCSWHRL